MKKFMMTIFAFGMSACALDATEDQSEQQPPDEEQVMASLEYMGSPKLADASALPRNAACGRGAPNLQNQVIVDAASPSGGANQRNGSSTGCPILGVLQPTDDARYYCWTVGSDHFTWTYARNMRTGVRGWTRDDLLKNFGSNRYCGF